VASWPQGGPLTDIIGQVAGLDFVRDPGRQLACERTQSSGGLDLVGGNIPSGYQLPWQGFSASRCQAIRKTSLTISSPT
jgi:hypothetical protein